MISTHSGADVWESLRSWSRCLESLENKWSPSGADVWGYSGGVEPLFGVTPEQVFRVTLELE